VESFACSSTSEVGRRRVLAARAISGIEAGAVSEERRVAVVATSVTTTSVAIVESGWHGNGRLGGTRRTSHTC